MNAKKCKALRKMMGGKIDGTIYHEIKRKAKLLPTGKLNEDGTQQMVVITPVTRVLGDCDRRTYQLIKRGVYQ
ncbi:hypothetical protein D3C77_248700 [compost metagenome]